MQIINNLGRLAHYFHKSFFCVYFFTYLPTRSINSNNPESVLLCLALSSAYEFKSSKCSLRRKLSKEEKINIVARAQRFGGEGLNFLEAEFSIDSSKINLSFIK